MIITVEIEPNQNCDYSPMQVFDASEKPWPVSRIKVQRPDGSDGWCRITGWSSEDGGTPIDRYCAKVGDSGSGFSFLIHGGYWGLRLLPDGLNHPWSLDDPAQWGEPYFLLGDLEDIQAA